MQSLSRLDIIKFRNRIEDKIQEYLDNLDNGIRNVRLQNYLTSIISYSNRLESLQTSINDSKNDESLRLSDTDETDETDEVLSIDSDIELDLEYPQSPDFKEDWFVSEMESRRQNRHHTFAESDMFAGVDIDALREFGWTDEEIIKFCLDENVKTTFDGDEKSSEKKSDTPDNENYSDLKLSDEFEIKFDEYPSDIYRPYKKYVPPSKRVTSGFQSTANARASVTFREKIEEVEHEQTEAEREISALQNITIVNGEISFANNLFQEIKVTDINFDDIPDPMPKPEPSKPVLQNLLKADSFDYAPIVTYEDEDLLLL
jgi:hypothetical protein